MRKIATINAIAVLIGAAVPYTAANATTTFSQGFNLQLVVPVMCSVSYSPQGVAAQAEAVGLGSLREYCNAPAGYELVVGYTPGTMRGAVLIVGDSTVMLDGSGEAIVSSSPRPRIRSLDLSAIPGEQGFDTDRLDFRIQAR